MSGHRIKVSRNTSNVFLVGPSKALHIGHVDRDNLGWFAWYIDEDGQLKDVIDDQGKMKNSKLRRDALRAMLNQAGYSGYETKGATL